MISFKGLRDMKKPMSYGFLLCLSYCQLAAMPVNNEINLSNQKLFEGKNILITGGTGFLGRSLTETILNYNPNLIKILSRDEVKLFKCKKLFKNNPKLNYVLGDVRDYEALLAHTQNIDLVIHAAALKRIDALESNVEECIKTNILGSLNVFNACIANKVKRVIFVSTDKACSPINIYGACKFASEKIFNNYDNKTIDTVFTTVRYGNVLESTGSVIPIFEEKIKNGEEITLTDPRMTRFIVGKDEAVALIFDAIRYGVGGEIFTKWLPAMTIVDLIEIIKEKYQANNPIRVTGIRPGEKIHEAMVNESEFRRAYAFNNMYVITPCLPAWLENLGAKNKIPVYINEGSPVDTHEIKDFTSADAIVSREEVKAIFKELAIL